MSTHLWGPLWCFSFGFSLGLNAVVVVACDDDVAQSCRARAERGRLGRWAQAQLAAVLGRHGGHRVCERLNRPLHGTHLGHPGRQRILGGLHHAQQNLQPILEHFTSRTYLAEVERLHLVRVLADWHSIGPGPWQATSHDFSLSMQLKQALGSAGLLESAVYANT